VGLAKLDTDNPYRERYFPKEILNGLRFYFGLLDRVNLEIYIDPKFPLKRQDILITISYLESIPKDSEVNRVCHSHPQLTWAMESIETLTLLPEQDLVKYDIRIMYFLEELLFSGVNIMVHDAKARMNQDLSDLSIDKKIEHLIENKYYASQNEGALPSKFIQQIVPYYNGLIEKYKELKEVREINPLNDEVKKLVEKYLSQLNNNIVSNDLISPLIAREYGEFITKLKRMLYIPSYFDIREEDRERMFHIYLLGVLQGKLTVYNLHSNKESGLGRYDIALVPIDYSHPAVIVEIKKIDKTDNPDNELLNALGQIRDKNYRIELDRLGIKHTLNIAIVFNGLEPSIKYESKYEHEL
jgi:hypothetical protein